MVDNSVIKYIKDSLSRGLSLEQIKKNLRDNGWIERDINEAINIVKSQQSGKGSQQSYEKPSESFSEPGPSKKILIFLGVFILVVAIVVASVFIFKNNTPEPAATCLELGGYSCLPGETCSGVLLDALGTDNCCSLECTPSCAENWTCTNWSNCVNHGQSRNCTDLNSCGTTVLLPSESQACGYTNQSLNCSGGNGCNLACADVGGGDPDCSCAAQDNASIQNITLCVSSDYCNGTIIDSNNTGACCVGQCTFENYCLADSSCNLTCANFFGDPDCSCIAQDNASIRNITLCAGEFYGCNGTMINSNNTESCCSGQCITPDCGPDGLCAFYNMNCGSGDGDCSCAVQTGTLCSGNSSSVCSGGSGNMLNALEFDLSSMYCCDNGCVISEPMTSP